MQIQICCNQLHSSETKIVKSISWCIHLVVYGAMLKKLTFIYFLLFCLFKPSPTRIELSPFFPLACMATISNSKWQIYRVFYRDRKIKLKSMSSCLSDHKDSKNVWFSICPMFGNGVMGQNVKRNERFYVVSHS